MSPQPLQPKIRGQAQQNDPYAGWGMSAAQNDLPAGLDFIRTLVKKFTNPNDPMQPMAIEAPIASIFKPELDITKTIFNSPEVRNRVNSWFGGVFPKKYSPTLWNETTGDWEKGAEQISKGITAWRAQPTAVDFPISQTPRYGTYFANGTMGDRSVGGYLSQAEYQGRTGGPNLVKSQFAPSNPFLMFAEDTRNPNSSWPSNVALEKLIGKNDYQNLLDAVSKSVEGHRATPGELNNLKGLLTKNGLGSSEASEVARYFETHDFNPRQVIDSIGNKKLMNAGYDTIIAQQNRRSPGLMTSGKPFPPDIQNEIVQLGRSNAEAITRNITKK